MASPKTLALNRERAAARSRSLKTLTNNVGMNREQYRKEVKALARRHAVPFVVAKSNIENS